MRLLFRIFEAALLLYLQSPLPYRVARDFLGLLLNAQPSVLRLVDHSKSGISFSQSSISSRLTSPQSAPFAGLFAGRTLSSILWPSIQSLISSTSAPVGQARGLTSRPSALRICSRS